MFITRIYHIIMTAAGVFAYIETRIAGDTCYFIDFIIPADMRSFSLEIE